jgi:hypothetical protein
VFPRAFLNFFSGIDQLRRIQHDDIKFTTVAQHIPHVSERVGLSKLNSHLIQVRIFLGEP